MAIRLDFLKIQFIDVLHETMSILFVEGQASWGWPPKIHPFQVYHL